MKRPSLHPGWKMTTPQHRAYWNLLQRAFKSYGSSGRESALTFESFRALIHQKAFGRPVSAKEIDRMKMFGDLKAACLAIIQPDNLSAQIAIAKANDPRTLLVHRILEFPASYIIGLINSPRFAHCRRRGNETLALEAIEEWSEKDLLDLRNTLCARKPSPPRSRGRESAPINSLAADDLAPF